MDKYVLMERLGQGSFAIVWKARRKSDNRLVAVKQLRQAPATWEECKRLPEIRAAAAVRGPHVIAMLEAVRHTNELFLVFEYADSDLYRCLGPGGPAGGGSRRFEEPQVRWVMRQLLMGLSAVHVAGLVHCDVKPENLLLFGRCGSAGEPVLKLCDLGQATPVGEVRNYVGTRWYRAPELLLGSDHGGVHFGAEVDLWAAGCAMAELFLLRPPFPGTDKRDMLFRICSALGAPEDGYDLSEQLMEASGLRFGPSAAEGPLWFELASSGASPPAVELARSLLRYVQGKRLPAAKALLREFFTGASATEVPIMPPETDKGKMRSVEGMQRSRDEAKAVVKKLQAASAAQGADWGNPGDDFMPLGVGPSQRAGDLPSWRSSRHPLTAAEKGGAGGALGSGSTAQPQWPGTGLQYGGQQGVGSPNTMPPRMRRVASQGAPAMASQHRVRPPGSGIPAPPCPKRNCASPTTSSASGLPGRGAGTGAAGSSSTANLVLPRSGHSGHSSGGQVLADADSGIGSGSEGDDDEELAALFWSQVEHSRGAGETRPTR